MKNFQDIMQKFYDDPKLGIKNEDAPANASGSAVAGTGDDSSTVVVKKKKKHLYDGRTKEGKEFFQRMAERRAKREEKSRIAKQVEEKTQEFAREYMFVESNLDIIKKIVKDKSMNKVKTSDKKDIKMDLFTASAILQVYNAVNKDNQKKMEKMLDGTSDQIQKIAKFALSKVK
jgi:hypothetical protein